VRRDMSLIRKILLAIEDQPGGFAGNDHAFDGFTPDQIQYHAWLLVDAGIVCGTDVTTMGAEAPQALITSLTWVGHEFCDLARDESRWDAALGVVKEQAQGAITFDVLSDLLKQRMRQALGAP
jgi:hypothetical protein